MFFDLAEFAIKGYEYFARFGYEYPISSCVIIILSIIGAITRNARFHATFAILVFLYNSTYILRKYETL